MSTDFRLTIDGVTFIVRVPRRLAAGACEVLPSGAHEVAPAGEPPAVSIAERRGSLLVLRGAHAVGVTADEGLALALLATEVRDHAATRAAELVPVRGGAVTFGGRGLLIAAGSLAGTTMLIDALSDAGATPCSDGFATLDRGGRLIGRGGACAVAAVVCTAYRPGARSGPEPAAAGPLVAELLTRAACPRARPADTLRALTAAVTGASLWAGPRGEAEATAATLLAGLGEAVAA